MKVLFTTSNLKKTGGIQSYNRSLLNSLKSNTDDVETLEIKSSSFLYKIVFIFKYFLKVLLYKPDYIFCTHINFSYLGLLSKTILGIDYIVFTHGVEVWIPRNKRSFKSIKKAKKVVSVSRHTAFQLESVMPNLKDKLFILPNTVDENKFKLKQPPNNSLIKKHNLEDNKVLFTLARLSFWDRPKGYDQVIKSLPEIKKEYPDIKYILGGDGDDLDRIKKLVKDLDLEDNVILPGYIPEDKLVDYYNLSDLFVMPSKKEGFGIVFIESLACGKPVIAGDRDGARDALLDGDLGFLVNPDNISYLSEIIVNILKGNVDNKNLIDSDYLRKKVVKEYGNEAFKDRVKKLIKYL